MSVDVERIFFRVLSFTQSLFNCFCSATTIRFRRGVVVSVTSVAISADFAIDFNLHITKILLDVGSICCWRFRCKVILSGFILFSIIKLLYISNVSFIGLSPSSILNLYYHNKIYLSRKTWQLFKFMLLYI